MSLLHGSLNELLANTRLLLAVKNTLPRDHPLRSRIQKAFQDMDLLVSEHPGREALMEASEAELDRWDRLFATAESEFEAILSIARKHVQ